MLVYIWLPSGDIATSLVVGQGYSLVPRLYPIRKKQT